jgi:NAD(P)H-dependent flavin oxidoreductase YrpB (nitropropane dioxygenase family)
MKSIFCQKIGIQYPIMSGGMHHASYAELAAAVSEAGGLGIITSLSQSSAEDLRKEIRKCKTLTKKPIGVNLTLLPAMVPPDYKGYCQVIIDEGIKVVETAGNNPGEYIKMFKEAGIIVIHKTVSIRHALTAQRLGVDFLSIDGFDCGGHPGQDDVGNWVLLAQAARKLKIPFIASGGIATGRQMAAAFALGCEGINMGTRFLCSKECTVRDEIKQAIVKGTELDTVLVFRTLNNTERVYKNKTALKVIELETEKPGEFEVIRPYVSGTMYKDSFHLTGDIQSSVWSCGQSMGLIDEVLSCKEIIDSMVKECKVVISSMNARL